MKKKIISKVDQAELFDRFAHNYDLLLEDWEQDIKKQSDILARLFEAYSDAPVKTVLDCTCGIGTQCIGLAMLGYKVTGTDISSKSILRARDEARRFGMEIEFKKADIRCLDETLSGKFDAVISCDNSVALLMSEEELESGLKHIFQRVDSSGLCVISIRDYDRIFAEKKRFNPRHIHEIDGDRLIIFDVWNYQENEFVSLDVFYLWERDTGFEVECRQMVFRAIYRDNFIRALKKTGFAQIDVIDSLDGIPLQFDHYICKKV